MYIVVRKVLMTNIYLPCAINATYVPIKTFITHFSLFHKTMIFLKFYQSLKKQLYEYLLSLWKLYFGPSCCCKDSCFSFQECCCFACSVHGGREPLQRTTIANEINRNSKTDLGPMQNISFLIWSSR